MQRSRTVSFAGQKDYTLSRSQPQVGGDSELSLLDSEPEPELTERAVAAAGWVSPLQDLKSETAESAVPLSELTGCQP